MSEREDRRRYTMAGEPKKRPGPKPSAFPNVRHRTRAAHKYWYPLHVTMRAKRGLPSFRAETLYAAFEFADFAQTWRKAGVPE